MKKDFKLNVGEEDSGKRLDIFVSLHINDLSRSALKKIIESNQARVNGEVEYRANYKVREGDSVYLQIEEDFWSQDESSIVPENIDLDVLYEDEDLIVINKPRGMVVHPATGNWTGTVMNALMYKYKNLKDIGTTIRSGLIHRLDKDTSGILLVGKTNKGLWHYSKLFSTRKVEKFYLSVSVGSSNVEEGDRFILRNYVGRNPKNRKKMKVLSTLDVSGKGFVSKKFQKLKKNQVKSSRGRHLVQNLPSDARIAVSEFEVLEKNRNKYLIQTKPLTGRTHQIRVHLSSLDMPIIGDSIYGGEKNNILFLHAYKIKIVNPSGKLLSFVAKPDKIFLRALRDWGFKKKF